MPALMETTCGERLGVVEIVAVKASKNITEPQPSIMRLQMIQ
jgi:hypothetical protein